MSGMDWQDRVSRIGVENWKRAALKKLDTLDADREAYLAWARTPRGRATLFTRRIRNAPYRFRYWLASLIFPGNLDELRDGW